MTKKQLEKLKKLMKEAEHLKAKLEKPASLREMVIDSVKDYRTGYPHNIIIAGCGQNNYPDLQQKYYDKLQKIQQEIATMEDWLDAISDPELRDILRLQYADGLTQEEVADELGYSRATIARRIKEFWKNEKLIQNDTK